MPNKRECDDFVHGVVFGMGAAKDAGSIIHDPLLKADNILIRGADVQALPLPLPEITEDNRHFWTGGAEGKLQFQYCPQCDYYLHPPGPVCPKCYQRSLVVKAVSGKATLLTFSLNYQPWMPGLEVPYAVGIVEMAEQKGLRLTTNIVNCELDKIQIGMPVQVVFQQADDVYLPLFEPVRG